MCPGRGSNPHSRCGEQDFKSCVSTDSTTGAPFRAVAKLAYAALPETKKSIVIRWILLFGAEDEIRTRDPHLGKVMLYQLSYFRMNHILRCVVKNFLFRWDCKGKISEANPQKIQAEFICISECTRCFQALPP